MPRTPQVRYFESRGAYYTQYRGKQRLLASGPQDEPDGPTYRAAVERFSRLMQADGVTRVDDGCLVSAVMVRYFHVLEREKRRATLHIARTLLDPAIAEFGHMKVKDLLPITVTDWLAKMSDPSRSTGKGRHRAWNVSTQNTAAGVLNRVFSWASKQKIVASNPIAGMEKPAKLVRGKEVVIPEPLQDLLIATANRELSKLLRVLRGTGARPGELIHAECSHYRPDAALVFPWNPRPGEYQWKNGRKTRRDRVIYLSPDVDAVVRAEVAARCGKGRIFRTVRGVDYTTNNLTNLVIKLASHEKVKRWCEENRYDGDKIMSYGFRHSYITRMLKAGCPIKLLADLCGTSVTMIERTYSHAHDDHEAMRRLFLHFTAAASVPPRP